MLSQTCFLYVAPAVLKLSVDQAGLELTEIHLPLPPECWDKGMHHHVRQYFLEDGTESILSPLHKICVFCSVNTPMSKILGTT